MFRSLLCTGRGHAQNLFTSHFALFQSILHAQVSGLVPRYRTKSGVSRLISLYKPLLIVFSRIRNRWSDRKFISTMIVMHIELVIKSDTTRAGFIFADLNFEALFYPVSKQKVLVSERNCALTTEGNPDKSFSLKFAAKLLLKVEICAVFKFLKNPPSYLVIAIASFPWRAMAQCAAFIQLCPYETESNGLQLKRMRHPQSSCNLIHLKPQYFFHPNGSASEIFAVWTRHC